ncbi:helix-turn-helix domain-containing protein [Streptomyces yaizuensis]|uniref:Helix-turn-helix domain-containing protein n=1 Tax=Streptomyces yaizuensis TaxID=2989713 RepID=A0ABQ5P697_9ACTN|nr:helix-turn-helix domain-containing protein [Streptomyces sp. YSPA8]GLF98118.1 hypothetical protein SYYSPA8_27495 [Streptomyces sp. YSPA8]
MPPTTDTLPVFPRGLLRPAEREAFAATVLAAYRTRSIRAIAGRTGRSYGSVHAVLADAGVLRPRGHPGRPSATTPAPSQRLAGSSRDRRRRTRS